MAHPFRARWWPALVLVLALAFVFGPGCGKDKSSGPTDDPLELPAAWAGIWSIVWEEKLCDSPTIISTDSEVDTLCAGQELAFEGEDVDSVAVDCEGTVTDTKIEVTCTSSGTYEEITYTFTSEIVMNRNGNSMNGTARFTTKIGDEVIDCTENTMVATRIGPAPDPCESSSSTFLDRRIEAAVADAFER